MKKLKNYALLSLSLPISNSKAWSVPVNNHKIINQPVSRLSFFPIEFSNSKKNTLNNSLKTATMNKDYEEVFSLIEKGADLYAGGSQSALNLAFVDQDFPYKKLADIKAKDKYGNTPLKIAMLYKNKEAFKKIIFAERFNLPKFDYGHIQDGEKKIPSYPNVAFEFAVRNEINDVVNKMVEMKLVDINSPNEFGEKPIYQLISKNRNDLVKEFLNEEDLIYKSKLQETLFERALASKNSEILRLLLTKANNNQFVNMLEQASRDKHALYLKNVLLELDLSTTKNKECIFWATNSDYFINSDEFLKKINYKLTQEDFDTYYLRTNRNFIGEMCHNNGFLNGGLDKLSMIIKNGYDINSISCKGEPLLYTLLTNKAIYERDDFVKLLINKGTDLLFVTNSGETISDALVPLISKNKIYEDLLKKTNRKLLACLDNTNKIKITNIIKQNENTEKYNKVLILSNRIIEKYLQEKKESKNQKSFEKLTNTLQNICDIRSPNLKKIILEDFFDVLYGNKTKKIKYNYEKAIIEKDIPSGMEGISVLLTKALFNNISPNKEKSDFFEMALKNAREKNCPNDTNEIIFDKAIKLLGNKHVRKNGPTVKIVLSAINAIIQRFDNFSGAAADLIANVVSISNTPKELVRNLNNMENIINNFKTSDIIFALNRDVMENFENIFESKYRKLLDIPDDTMGSFGDFYHKLRQPKSLITYLGKINGISEVKKAFIEDYIIPEMNGKFYENIYEETNKNEENKSHFSTVFNDRPELLKKWKEGYSFKTEEQVPSGHIKQFTVTQTKNPDDMFLIGTETSSCQDINGNPDYNKCLMGYILNPCTQGILIKSAEDGRIVARSIIRLLVDEDKTTPILMLEKNYISDGLAPKNYEQIITKFASDRAKEMGLSLISKDFSKYNKGKYKSKIVSLDSGKAPYEYSDSIHGITNGKYTITDQMNLLYRFELESKRNKSILDIFKNRLNINCDI